VIDQRDDQHGKLLFHRFFASTFPLSSRSLVARGASILFLYSIRSRAIRISPFCTRRYFILWISMRHRMLFAIYRHGWAPFFALCRPLFFSKAYVIFEGTHVWLLITHTIYYFKYYNATIVCGLLFFLIFLMLERKFAPFLVLPLAPPFFCLHFTIRPEAYADGHAPPLRKTDAFKPENK